MACIRFHSDFIQRGIIPEREMTLTRKKMCVKYFSMRNPFMKFQNPSMHGSWTDGRTTTRNQYAPSTSSKVGGIMIKNFNKAHQSRRKLLIFCEPYSYVMSLVNLYLHVWYRYSIKWLTRELETVCSEFRVKNVHCPLPYLYRIADFYCSSLFVQNSRLWLFILWILAERAAMQKQNKK